MRTHPPHIEEIRGRTFRERQHCPSRNPSAFDNRERNVSITEQRENSLANPPAMPEFDCESKIARKLSNEIDERGQLIRLEVRAELHENRTELGVELAHCIEELT